MVTPYKIKLDDVSDFCVQLDIKEDDPFWTNIYANFDTGIKVCANLKISHTLISSRYSVEGKLNLATKLMCRRCYESFDWSGVYEFKVYFIDEKEQFVKEKDLVQTDLDEYYASEPGFLDLELILSDMVNEGIPDVLDENWANHECIKVDNQKVDSYSVKVCSVGQSRSALAQALDEFKKKMDK